MIKIFDITKYPCPILFVKAKILLENLKSGQKVILRFKGKEAAKSLPKTLKESKPNNIIVLFLNFLHQNPLLDRQSSTIITLMGYN